MLKSAGVLAAVALTSSAEMMMETTSTSAAVCPRSGEDALRNSDSNVGFVIGWYGTGNVFPPGEDEQENALLWSYALDECTALAPVSGVYGKFSCVDSEHMQYSMFGSDDSKCTNDPLFSVTYNRTTLGWPYDFNCADDRAEGYAALNIATDKSCKSAANTYAAINVCTPTKIPPYFDHKGVAYMYCDAGQAALEFFTLASTMDGLCTDDFYCAQLHMTEGCSAMFQASSGVTIWSKFVDCTSKDASDDSDADDSAVAQAPALLAALLAALFAALA